MTTTSPLVQRAIVATAAAMDADADLFGVPVDLPGRAVVLLSAPVRLVVKVESGSGPDDRVTAGQARIQSEAAALGRLAGVSPVPEVWFFNQPEFEGDSAVLGTSYVDGERLSETSPDDAWESAGAQLAILHGQGTTDWGQHGSHPDLFNKWAVRLASEAKATDLLDETVATEFLQRTIVEAPTSRTPALIHGELTADHAFYDPNAGLSMIDLGDCGVGDPAYDFATLTLWHRDKLQPLLAGYNQQADLGNLEQLASDIARFHLMRLLKGALWLRSYEFTTTPYVSELYERLLESKS